jgi:hypothetical protein
MRVYAVTLFSLEGVAHQMPDTKLFLDEDMARQYYKSIELRTSSHARSGDASSLQVEVEQSGVSAHGGRPRGKMFQVHDLKE